jgi:hypothetical protein
MCMKTKEGVSRTRWIGPVAGAILSSHSLLGIRRVAFSRNVGYSQDVYENKGGRQQNTVDGTVADETGTTRRRSRT